MAKKKPRIVIEHIEKEGVRVRVDHAWSKDHAVWMLSEAITRLVLPEEQTVEVEEDEPVQELPDTDGSEEEVKLSDLPN